MFSIQQFVIDHPGGNLLLSLSDSTNKLSETWSFSFEFLRVVTLTNKHSSSQLPANSGKSKNVTSHKKSVQVLAVESLGKHGFRLLFDDEFQCIYSQEEFALLHQQRDTLWQTYLHELKQSGHTREASIAIKQL